jgi:Sulfotransferase domain
MDEDIAIMRRMTIYETVTFDREKYLAAYRRHYADVRQYFSGRSDLLEMSIVDGDGWDKLCPFVGLEQPYVPFSHAHKPSDGGRRDHSLDRKVH